MTENDGLELAIHRALRGEVPLCVAAIVCTELSLESIVLRVFHHGVQSELELCLPSSVPSAPRFHCEFAPASAFQARPGQLVIVWNPWSR